MIILMPYMSLEKPLEYVNPQVLVDTQWVEDQLTILHVPVTKPVQQWMFIIAQSVHVLYILMRRRHARILKQFG